MPTSRSIQTSLSAGEFDPLLWSREDVSFFYNSARIIENAVPLPQGGVKRREGWRFRALQRGQLTAQSSGATGTAPNGGTAANALDDNAGTALTTTTAIGTSTFYTFLTVDLTEAREVAFWDFDGLRIIDLPDGIDGMTLWVEKSDDNSTWTQVGSAIQVGNVAYNRRVGDAPGTPLGTARYWRFSLTQFVASGGSAIDYETATLEVLDVRAWSEDDWLTELPGNFSLHRLTSSIDNEYVIVATAGNADVFRGDTGEWVAAIQIPHTNGQVMSIKTAPNLDTLILYHEDQPPWNVQRLGSDRDWRSDAVEFDTITEFPFDTGAVDGGRNEIQFFRFLDMSAGDKVLIEFNGETSDEITWSTTVATNAAALKTAIESLPDFTSVTVTQNGGSGANANFDVEFTGVDGKRPWAILVALIFFSSSGGTVSVERRKFGRKDFDTLWNETRGYPRCGTFYQGRHWMGGFKARPDLIVGSRAGSLFEFKEDADPVSASPIVVAPNIDDQVTIQNIYPGRHLQIFTSSSEIYVPDEPITIDNIALKITTRHGSNAGVTPVDIQGGTLFVDRNGRALREYMFTDGEQSYTAEPVSLLAGHLMSSPRSLALRRALDVDEPTLLLIANTGVDRAGNDVPAAMVVIDRAQQVTGFCRVKTQGVPLEFATTQGGDGFAMVQRDLAGGVWNSLEQFDAEFMTDASILAGETENQPFNTDTSGYTATAGQTEFTNFGAFWSSVPTSEEDVAVFTGDGFPTSRKGWIRLAGDEYTVDLDTQTVTTAPQEAGTRIRIQKRQSTVHVGAFGPHLDAQTVFVLADGLPLGEFTVTDSEIDLGDDRFDFTCEVGLKQLPRIILHPYKGKGELSPTMQNMRIFRALLQLERTGAVAITAHDGGQARPVSLQNYDTGVLDANLEELLFTGTKRISGFGRWQKEPTIEITQIEPMPFLMRSITYDVRF